MYDTLEIHAAYYQLQLVARWRRLLPSPSSQAAEAPDTLLPWPASEVSAASAIHVDWQPLGEAAPLGHNSFLVPRHAHAMLAPRHIFADARSKHHV